MIPSMNPSSASSHQQSENKTTPSSFTHMFKDLIRFILSLLSKLWYHQDNSTRNNNNNNNINHRISSKQHSQLEINSYLFSDDSSHQQWSITPLSSSNENKNNNNIIECNKCTTATPMTSKYEAMRIKKHFTTSTNLLIRELNTPHFVGSFSNSTELKTIRKSPLSFLPFEFLSQLFTRHEYMLVKSAILVFITASLDHPTSATTTTATAAASTKNNNS